MIGGDWNVFKLFLRTRFGRLAVSELGVYSLLKTIEAAFGLPYIGHAKDATTNTMAPLLAPSQNEQ